MSFELAKFMNLSVSRAQKLKNENAIPFWQDGRTVLFDPEKVKEAMENPNNLKKRNRR